MVQGYAANKLGNARVPSQEGGAATAEPLDGTTHKILHAAVGAATGAILDPHHMGRGALAGAIGASVAEAVAEGLTAKGATAEEIQRNANTGRILAGIAALATGQDVGISIHSGTTAVENNFLSKKEVLEAVDNLLESVEEIDWVDVVETTEAAIDVGTLGAALLTAPESAGLSLAAREGLKRYATKPAFCYMKKLAASSGGKQLTTGSVKYLRTFLRGLKQETKVSNVVKPKIKYSASEIKVPTVKESLKTSGRVDTGSGKVVKPKVDRAAKNSSKLEIRPGEEWKLKIEGKAQRTGTSGHELTSLKKAIEHAKDPSSSRIHLNRGINRIVKDATGINPRIKPNSRPDVAVTFKDKKINQVEVRSKTDDAKILRARMDATRERLPKEMRGKIDLVDASKDMP